MKIRDAKRTTISNGAPTDVPRGGLDRRSFLVGLGAALALPSLACGASDDENDGESLSSVEQGLAPSTKWWRSTFVGGKSRYHRGLINYGIMGSSAYSTYKSVLGCEPDAAGGSTINKISNPPTTWARIIGGDYADGVAADVSGTLVDWAGADKTSYTLALDGAWVVPHGPTAPLGITWEDFLKLGRGTLRVGNVNVRDMYRRMGQRIARHCRANGKPLSQVIMRPNHEGMNQDTYFRLAEVQGKSQLYLVGRAKGASVAEITEAYNRAVNEWARGLWDGCEERVHIALSPAMQAQGGVPDVPYEDFMSGAATGIYDMVCFSFHPSPGRMPNDAQMRAIVESETIAGFNTPAKALKAARWASGREGRSVAMGTLEWSCREDVDLFADSLERYPRVVDVLYNFLEANANDVAFLNLHAPQTSLDRRAISGIASAANERYWGQYVDRVTARHRRKS